MSNPTLLAVATSISAEWARRGGPRSEFAIACCGDHVSAVVEIEAGQRCEHAARRAALGALVPLTDCGTFGYIANTTATIDGRTGDALLLLELEIVCAAERSAGAEMHMAPYWRSKRRFGKDVIGCDAFVPYECPVLSDMIFEITTIWPRVDHVGRRCAMTALSATGAQWSDLDPAVQTELELLTQPA